MSLLTLMVACSGVEDPDAIGPTAVILIPAADTQWSEGVEVELIGAATDPDYTARELTGAWTRGEETLCEASLLLADGTSHCSVVPQLDWTEVTFSVSNIDGLSSQATAQVVVAASSAPQVRVDEPVAGQLYYSDVAVGVAGQVRDDEDSPGALSLSWSSSVDGDLGALALDETGAFSTSADLSLGDQTLTFVAVDSAGTSSATVVDIRVGDSNAAPECAVSASSDLVQSGQTVLLTASASDDRPDPLTAWWRSSLDGELGVNTITDGAAELSVALSYGAHTITLDVTDSLGAIGADTVQVDVRDAPTIAFVSAMSIIAEGTVAGLVATAHDTEDADVLLGVVYESNLDGVLAAPLPNEDGQVTLWVDDLSVGTHVITATVTDSDGFTSTDHAAVEVNGSPTPPAFVSLRRPPSLRTI